MLDFLRISTRSAKSGVIEIYPNFVLKTSSDLMIRGGDFYAIWVEDRGLWSTDEEDAVNLIDRELDKYMEENKSRFNGPVRVMHMWDSETGMVDRWHRYCQKQMWDSYHMLDEKLIFSNAETNKKDYASKRLNYPLEKGSIDAYETLISTLYAPKERHKIEWCIGSIVSGESKKLQKFMVLYGAAGTGKSTIINIIQQLFDGYYAVFDSKALGSSTSTFALEAFKANPLVALEHDGDLSRIEDNTRLNSLVSHEKMTVNEKFKSTYTNDFKCFLVMGTNRPVRITDAKSGLLRRLIDVTPTGEKLNIKEYNRLVKQISFELGHIAYHCQEVYLADPHYYDSYTPLSMLGATNDFYNYVLDSFSVFKQEDGTTLSAAWKMYKVYCEDAKVPYPYSQRVFKEELKNYFRDYKERFSLEDGSRVRSYYSGFKEEKFVERKLGEEEKQVLVTYRINFDSTESIFDKVCADCPAQYASDKETPMKKWTNVKTNLSDLDTTKLHYVKVPENHIVIDFDIPDENGNKCFEKNLEEASKWPPTYAELSKSGQGIHLHYIYSGDPSKLSVIYKEHVEIKVSTGNSSLRRKLTKCNTLPIATISSGLPLKGEKKMVHFDQIKSEKGLRTQIKKNLNKEIHSSTKSSIDFIYKILEDAYASDLKYDVSDMYGAILAFVANSTNKSDYCLKLVGKMKLKSREDAMYDAKLTIHVKEPRVVFYDVEVFPNLFLINWKFEGENEPVIRMINPSPEEVEDLLYFKLIGFNNRRYDNHMLYARILGYSNEALFRLSQKIVNSKKGENGDAFFGEAYNISYTDVYDFSAKKQSLKKWEIELGIHHQELGLPWDKPVPEDMWMKVAEYCDNDVIATEKVFNHLKADWTARQILADLADGSVNNPTNSLSTKIIFGREREPQYAFHYRNLAEPVMEMDDATFRFLSDAAPEMMTEKHGEAGSLLPYFPGYTYQNGKSIYRGEEVGEGGYVYAEPGMYGDVALLDIASMHPHSTIMEVLFGVEFTKRFKEIVDGRVSIKHEAWDKLDDILDGKLKKYIQKVLDGELTSTDLANALKIVINSVYGLTAAGFKNPFRDIRNVDNIVAKRGALFMVDLKNEVQNRGFTVVHIKTDSIKIADATPEIIRFVMNFGKRYGYTFEHEATYEKMCLVNNAVYIAKYKDGKKAGTWTATGKQFAVPYLFKTLFSKEPIVFEDMCETKEVKTALYLDMNEQLPDVSEYEVKLEKAESKYKKGQLSDMTFDDIRNELNPLIEKGHDLYFIGKVGLFCPVKRGAGGGILLRQEKDGRYSAAEGTSGYRWMEAEMVRTLEKEKDIDRGYYERLVNDAVEAISQYGDFEWFVSDDPYARQQKGDDDLPF